MSETLGSKIGSYGLDQWYLFQLFLVWGSIVYLLVFVLLLRLPLIQPAVLLLWLVLYAGTAAGWSMVYPVIVVYDRGLVVVNGSKRSTWRWQELSRMTGTRHAHRIDAIPIARWGANQFYAAKGEAFSVGAWTADADALVDFILMKMTELRIPAEIKRLQSGTLRSYGETHVNTEGIDWNNQLYPWSAIRGLRFQYWTEVNVTLDLKNGKSIRLDSMDGLEFYTFVGTVDHFLGSKYSHEIQQDRIKVGRRMKHTFSTAARITLMVIGLTILGVVGVSAIFMIEALMK